MTTDCDRVLEILAKGASLEDDAAAAAHAATCPECGDAVKAAAELDESLAALARIDAPDALVERLLARPELRQRSLLRSPWILSSVAAALLLVAAGVALYRPRVEIPPRRVDSDKLQASREVFEQLEQKEADDAVRERLDALGELDAGKRRNEAESQEALSKDEAAAPTATTGGVAGPLPADEPPPYLPPAEERESFALYRRVAPEANAPRGPKLDQAVAANLSVLEPSGYWANTYLPGDPRTRVLAARLAELDASGRFRAWSASLHEQVVRVDEPFDAPESSALSLYFDADHTAVSGSTRMIVQVGLKAAERHARRRPVMNLALAMDLRGELPLDRARKLRALALAFAEAKESGDRFRLLASGREPIPPEGFDRDRLAALFDRTASATGAGSLEATLEEAIAAVADAEAADAVLGTSGVVLVVDRPLGAELPDLERLAQRSAVSGIPVSAIALGSAVPDEVERIALAGQGARFVLEEPADAPRVVEAELAASSRVVARAVRLRIRLAPDVQLVGVLGSRRLDENAAQQVREAERSLDERLAENLGIASDRGEDEEGIQILVPAFYAGDTHVILLDVVVPGPGPVGDVTARYKDIGALRNAVSRASLALASGERAEGPLQLNVTKNLLAHRLSEALEAASDRVAVGDLSGASARLEAERTALERLASERPQLDDAGLRRDLALLDEYLTLLRSGAASEVAARDYLSTSLAYASRVKIQPPLSLQ